MVNEQAMLSESDSGEDICCMRERWSEGAVVSEKAMVTERAMVSERAMVNERAMVYERGCE